MNYLLKNDWTGKYYQVNDRKSAVSLGNRMIEEWKEEMVGKDYNPKDYDFETVGDFRNRNYKYEGLCDWKYEIDITLIPFSEIEVVK